MDHMAPPPISDQAPRIYVDHTDWLKRAGPYAVDVRPMTTGGMTFPISIDLPKEKKFGAITLTWAGIKGLPANLKVRLVDDQKKKTLDMRKKTSYKFTPGKGLSHYNLRVTIQ